MAQTYFAILTAIGEAKLANATALGTTLQLTKMAVGDGNGATPIPDRNQTALVHENRRAPLNALFVDPANGGQVVAEQIIPEDIGGWWIREIGLYDAAGDLCAVANCPDTYKPVLASGSGRTQILRMVLIVANTSSVELKVDPSVVLAPRGYVDQVMTAHTAAIDPHPQYATDADLAAHAAAADPHPQYLTSAEGDAKVAEAVAALVAASPAALDTLAELATALGSDPNFATTVTNALAAKAPLASPALTGNPTAPTPASGDNDSSLATTEFVQAAILAKLNATGGAPLYAARAWVNFNGTGTVAIRASGNVSSITDNGTGDYTVNFTTAMPAANFAVSPGGNGSADPITGVNCLSSGAKTTTSVRISTTNSTTGRTDFTNVELAVFC